MVCFLRLFSRTITPNDALRGSADECPALKEITDLTRT